MDGEIKKVKNEKLDLVKKIREEKQWSFKKNILIFYIFFSQNFSFDKFKLQRQKELMDMKKKSLLKDR